MRAALADVLCAHLATESTDGAYWILCAHGDPADPYVFRQQDGGTDAAAQHRHAIRLSGWIAASRISSELTRAPFHGRVLAPGDHVRLQARLDGLAPEAPSFRIFLDM